MATFAHSGRSRRLAGRRGAGFSLVEVTLAVGIVAFAFVTLLGLIPTGLNVMHQAMDATTGSAITQLVINDAQQTNFTNLTSSAANPTATALTTSNGPVLVYPDRYFDDQGDEVAATTPFVYQVHTLVAAATTVPDNQSLATTSPSQLTTLATITVQIASNPGHMTPAVDPTTNLWNDSRLPITSYSGYAAQCQ